MKKQVYLASQRGEADFVWLKAKYSFSFANYYNPERIHFGVLRVLNDDIIAAGEGFPTHPHDNMEIITIPLTGAIEHEDTMGSHSVVRAGEIQVMSAGHGVYHSEFNPNKSTPTNLLQIWLFPNKKDVKPRYQDIKLDDLKRENDWYQIVSPDKNDQGGWIYQDAWFSMGDFTEDTSIQYKLKSKNNGLYVFLIEGKISLLDEVLNPRDAMSISDIETVDFEIKAGSRILLIDVPMQNKS